MHIHEKKRKINKIDYIEFDHSLTQSTKYYGLLWIIDYLLNMDGVSNKRQEDNCNQN